MLSNQDWRTTTASASQPSLSASRSTNASTISELLKEVDDTFRFDDVDVTQTSRGQMVTGYV
jgi:hypothetical protein